MAKKESSEYTEGLGAKKTSNTSKLNNVSSKKTPKGAKLELKAVPKSSPIPRATRTFRVYEGGTLLGEGASPVSLAGKLKPNTNYNNLKIAAVEDGLQSALVAVPAFKTLDNTVHVTGVTVNPTTFSMKPSENVNVQVTVSPADATNKAFTVSGVNSNVATHSINGNTIKFTGVAAGSFTATVTTADGNKTATIAVTVTAANIPVTGVDLKPDTTTVSVGGTVQLTATVQPANATNKTVSYKSSDTTKATVDASGKVKGVAAGTADITVTTADGNKTDKTTVTVTTASIPVTGVDLKPDTASVAVGATTQLTATVQPANATNKAVTYKSSDTTKATVDASGKVKGVAAGTADITVTTADGNKTDKTTVTVTNSNVPVTGITLPQTNYAGKVGTTIAAITPIIEPANATVKTYSIKSGDATKVQVQSDNSLKLLAEVKDCPVTFTTTDGGFTATAHVTVTGETPDIKPTMIEVAPNPVRFPKGTQGAATITITPDNASNHEAKIGTITGEGIKAEYKWRQVLVTGTKPGKGTVEVIAAGDESVKTTLNVEVTDENDTKVTKIFVDPANVDLEVLKSVNTPKGLTDLRATEGFVTVSVAPDNATNKGFIVESTEPDTMQLDITEGIGFTITALKATKAEGGATLTVTSTDNPEAKAFVKVNIKEIAIPDIEDILLYPDALTVKVGEEKDTTVQLKPDEGRNYYQIKNVTSDKPDVSTPRFLPQATAIVAEGHKEGTAKLTVEAWNPNVPDKVVKKVLTVTVTK